MIRTLALVTAAAAASLALAAPSAQAVVTPGVMTTVEESQCTANFLFTDGSATYLGSAAHCAGEGGPTDTNGCETDSKPPGTPVQVEGAQDTATLAYSSWLAMHANGESNEDACEYNDFALYRLSAADAAAADPTVPVFGGPHGVGTAQTGDLGASYQNSSVRGGIGLLSPKNDIVLARDPSGWTYDVYTITPGLPGDSGSGYLNSRGQAFGVLSTIQFAPFAGSNGVTDLGMAMQYARANGMPGLQILNGRRPFRNRLLGLL